jgi:hypothetical protein
MIELSIGGYSMKSMISIQETYIETINAGMARWAHRKDGGHMSRIRRGARTAATKQLARLGFNEVQIEQAIKDAQDLAELERKAREE